MNSSRLLIDLRDALDDLETKAQASVQVGALRTYLADWERNMQSSPVADNESIRAAHIEQYKHQLSTSSAWSLEMFEAVIEAGQSALKAATIINGGAAAAVLAFIGSAMKPGALADQIAVVSPLGSAWFCFMLGLGVAGTASGFRYLSQAGFAQSAALDTKGGQRWGWFGTAFQIGSVILGIAAFAAFFVGSWKLARIFQSI